MRARFKLGSKATLEQIEEVWDELFVKNKTDWPHCRRLHHELMRDSALKRHLIKRWKKMESEEHQHSHFWEVRGTVLIRIFWVVVRNAHSWLEVRAQLQHWARFWHEEGLTGELRRAIDDLLRSEGSREPVRNYQGQRQEQPEELFALKEKMLRFCGSQQERELIADWFDNARQAPEKEIEVLARHARSPGTT